MGPRAVREPSGGDGDLVDLVRRVAGALVDAPHRLGARPLREAEDVTAHRVGAPVRVLRRLGLAYEISVRGGTCLVTASLAACREPALATA